MKLTPSSYKIFQQDWLEMYPYAKPVHSDIYYVRLANKILSSISVFGDKGSFCSSNLKDIALCTTAYFEDIISGFGLWRAFWGEHYRLYGKYLPFYDLDGYYMEDEINEEDVRFLVWNIVQRDATKQRHSILNPENPVIGLLSLHIYGILDDEYESAPENEALQSVFSSPELYAGFYEFREQVSWFFYDSYLMRPYTKKLLDSRLKELDESVSEFIEMNRGVLKYMAEVGLLFDTPCGPLGLKVQEWMSAIAGEESETGRFLMDIKSRRIEDGDYLVTGEDDDKIRLLSPDGEELFLSKLSYWKEIKLVPQEDVIVAGLVYFKGSWYINGVLTRAGLEQYRDAAVRAETRKHGNQQAYDCLMKANKGKPVVFLKDAGQLRLYMDRILRLDDKLPFRLDKEMEDWQNLVVFAHPEEGLRIYPHLAVCLKDQDNPYYDQAQAEDEGFGLLVGEYSVSPGFIDYIIENNLVPDLALNSLKGPEYGRKQVQDNLGFLFRFFHSCF